MSEFNPPPAPSQPSSVPAYPQNYQARFNVLAIVGFILAFVFALAGLIVSAISLSQIKRTGERGRPLALWGLILSIVFLVFQILWTIVIVIAVAHGAANGTTY